MRNIACACVAAIAIGTFASTACAMSIGSLSRHSPVIAGSEAASIAEPAICHDLTCAGVGGRTASDIEPVFHTIFATVGTFVDNARIQLISTAAAG